MKTKKFVQRIAMALILSLMFLNINNMNINAKNTYGYEYLTDEAKAMVDEISIGADNVQYYIPKTQTASVARNASPYIMVSKTISSEKVAGQIIEQREETLLALTTQDGSFSASGQKYGIVASVVVNITWTYSDPLLSDLKIKFNSMTAKYTSLPTASVSVTKMEYSAALRAQYGPSVYFQANSVDYPQTGIPYTTVLNSDTYPFGGEMGAAMLSIYYSNGESSTYEGLLSAKH